NVVPQGAETQGEDCMFRALPFCAFVALLSFSPPASVSAQTTYATITGTIHDPSGAAVGDATITATNTATGVVSTTTSNKEGVYTVSQLREGPYLMTVKKDGFSEAIVTDIILVARD